MAIESRLYKPRIQREGREPLALNGSVCDVIVVSAPRLDMSHHVIERPGLVRSITPPSKKNRPCSRGQFDTGFRCHADTIAAGLADVDIARTVGHRLHWPWPGRGAGFTHSTAHQGGTPSLRGNDYHPAPKSYTRSPHASGDPWDRCAGTFARGGNGHQNGSDRTQNAGLDDGSLRGSTRSGSHHLRRDKGAAGDTPGRQDCQRQSRGSGGRARRHDHALPDR